MTYIYRIRRDYVRRLLECQGSSIQAFAARSGVSHRTVTRLLSENRPTTPSLSVFLNLARALNMDPLSLVEAVPAATKPARYLSWS
jgi:transcriptional regulator with XRE-family HTH domain